MLFTSTLFLSLLAQQTTPFPTPNGETPAKKGRIEGKAIHAITGEPIRRADVLLRTTSGAHKGSSVATDSAGIFVFENLVAGEYNLSGLKADFVGGSHHVYSPNGTGSLIRVEPGSELKDVVLRMIPTASASGRILDEDGDPLEGVQVQLLRKLYTRNGRIWLPAGSASTNDRGEFRIAGITPGNFLFSANLEGFGAIDPLQKGKEKFSYIFTYFPGVDSPEAAEQVAFAPGQARDGLTMKLLKTRVFHIRGKYTGPLAERGGPPRAAIQALEKNSSSFAARTMYPMGNRLNGKDGSFEVANLKPGTYTLRVLELDGSRPRTLGSAEVVVSNDNVEGVVIALQPPVTLAGKVLLEGDSKALELLSMKSFRVELQPADLGQMLFGDSSSTTADDGSFKLEGLSPERVRVSVMHSAAQTYVKAIRAGSQDYRYQILDLSTGAPELEIIISTRVAKLQGTVERASPDSLPGSLYLENVEANSATTWSTISVNQNGEFHTAGLAPGEYRAYAFAGLDSNIVQDREFLRSFESRSVLIRLGEGESKSVTLKQIPTSEIEAARK